MTHLPRATYRLQLHADFDFGAARRILPYLARLGISDVYLSPIWQSVPGSTHGYDVTDHSRINDALGGERGLRQLATKAAELGLSLLVDFVPNHMGIAGGHNPYWEDVLKHGQASRYAHFFDIEWQPLKRALEGKVLLPVLGEQYGQVLANGELQLVYEADSGRFAVQYYERRLPLSPVSYSFILERVVEGLEGMQDRAEVRSLSRAASYLPSSQRDLSDEERLSRAEEGFVIERRLLALAQASGEVRRAIDAVMAQFGADTALLDRLMQEQNYRLASWRVAAEQINYRRFFDVNDLAALRMEDPRVFDWAHSKLFELIRDGVIWGVRLDHTDGLYDPAGYFAALQAGAAQALGAKADAVLPLYVVAEKILEPGEKLPPDWAIHGTTGYDFLGELGGTLVDHTHADEISAIYRRFTGDRRSYPEHLYQGKMLIQRVALPGEVNVLAERLERLAEQDLRWRDLTLSQLREAIRQTIACFPVYRSYIRPAGREPGDNAHIAQAIAAGRAHALELGRAVDTSAFDFLQLVLTLDTADEQLQALYAEFAFKFQQLTGPVTAKGAEDTAFYRYLRLVSLNEVGSDPAQFGLSVAHFHQLAAVRGQHWPAALLAASTHDTKRGEDTRARISVLSEMPQRWAAFLTEQSERLAGLSLSPLPSLGDTYGLLQNALGIYPLSGDLDEVPQRLAAYMVKAAREAKLHTDWGRPDEAYEQALQTLVQTLFADADFVASLRALHEVVTPHGIQNALSAALVRLTAPGIPDTYQGCEGWNQSLVDPDNRRPVDYAGRNRTLSRLEKRHAAAPLATLQAALDDFASGTVKQLVTWLALQVRLQHPDLFALGDYQPVGGGKHLLGFSREYGGWRAIILVPRLTYTLTAGRQPWATGEIWGRRSVKIPAGHYRNVITGQTVRVREQLPLAKAFEDFPLALLLGEG